MEIEFNADTRTTKSDPFGNWNDMKAALPQQKKSKQKNGTRPKGPKAQKRSALLRFQQRQVAPGSPQSAAANKGPVKLKSNQSDRCANCINLVRKNKQMKRLVKRLHGKLNSFSANQQNQQNQPKK